MAKLNSLDKNQRLAIHRFIVGMFIAISLIFSFSIFLKTIDKTKPFPETEYRVEASGIITHKYRDVNQNGWMIVDNKKVSVKEQVMTDYSVGDHVELLIDNGPIPSHLYQIVWLILNCIGLAVFAFISFCIGIEKYFDWLKGGKSK